MCKYFLTIFSLHFYYPARGIFLISVLAHQLYRLQTPTHEADSKIKGHLPGEGRWVGIRCCHMSAGYLGGTLLGLLSHFTLATPQHTKWIGLAFSELCPFGPQSVLDVLNGLHGSEWLTWGMVMKFWKWISTEKQKNCRPCSTQGCWEPVCWCKRITRTLNLDLLNKGGRKLYKIYGTVICFLRRLSSLSSSFPVFLCLTSYTHTHTHTHTNTRMHK